MKQANAGRQRRRCVSEGSSATSASVASGSERTNPSPSDVRRCGCRWACARYIDLQAKKWSRSAWKEYDVQERDGEHTWIRPAMWMVELMMMNRADHLWSTFNDS